jgi:hypothetical protein
MFFGLVFIAVGIKALLVVTGVLTGSVWSYYLAGDTHPARPKPPPQVLAPYVGPARRRG